MDDLANALWSHDTTDLSDEALHPIRFITSRLEGFSTLWTSKTATIYSANTGSSSNKRPSW